MSWSTPQPFGKELVRESGSSLSEGLAGYWSFNETVLNGASDLGFGPTDFYDLSGHNGHGLESGGVQVSQRGRFAGAVRLDGVDDSVDLYTHSTAPNSPESTVSFWFQLDHLSVA